MAGYMVASAFMYLIRALCNTTCTGGFFCSSCVEPCASCIGYRILVPAHRVHTCTLCIFLQPVHALFSRTVLLDTCLRLVPFSCVGGAVTSRPSNSGPHLLIDVLSLVYGGERSVTAVEWRSPARNTFFLCVVEAVSKGRQAALPG